MPWRAAGRFLRSKAKFAAHLPDVTITVAASHKTAYFSGNYRVLVLA
jgi:hypothetical protein